MPANEAMLMDHDAPDVARDRMELLWTSNGRNHEPRDKGSFLNLAASDGEATGMCDVRTRADIDALLRAFYTRVFDDDLLRHVFVEVAHMDLEEHLPVLGDFWEKVLFNSGVYGGNAMRVHRRIHDLEPLTAAHFERWLALWNQTLEAHHVGPVATAAKEHAARIAVAMRRDLGREATPRNNPSTSVSILPRA